MPQLLHIDSSPRQDSTSSSLAKEFVDRYTAKHAGTTVVHHNTTTEALPFVSELMIQGGFLKLEQRSPEMKEALAFSDKLTHELLDATVVVIGMPMWNFGVPASLKAWIDLIVRNGLTFQYGPAGPSGLIPPGKKVYLLCSRGGEYAPGSSAHAYDLQEPYMRAVLGFLGVNEVTTIIANNQNRGPEEAREGLEKAKSEIAAALA